MPDQIEHPTPDEEGEVKAIILENIQLLMQHEKVEKVYFVDDAVNQDTGIEKFKGIINDIIADGKIGELRQITIEGINFNTDSAVLLEHIDEVWSTLKHSKQLRYFDKVYSIAGKPEAIRDLNFTNILKDYFGPDQIEFLSPNEWDERNEAILA